MPFFEGKWERKKDGNEGVAGWKKLVRSQAPVKPQIERATKEISVLIAKLDQAEARIKSRDQLIFTKVVHAISSGDKDHAAVYANELSEVRKIGANLKASKLALEQVTLRLRTVSDMGDVAATLAPTVAVMRGIGQGLGGLLPTAEGELAEISSLLSSTLVEAGSIGGTSLNFKAANDEAEQVLEEASAVASRRMEEELPPVPKVPAASLWETDDDGALPA